MKKIIILVYLIPFLLFTGCSTISQVKTGRVIDINNDELIVEMDNTEKTQNLNYVSYTLNQDSTYGPDIERINISEKYAQSFYIGEKVQVTYGMFDQVQDVEGIPYEEESSGGLSGFQF